MTTATVGVDVAKHQLDIAAVWDTGQASYHRFANTPDGYQACRQWLQQHQLAHVPVCLEATGRYGDGVAHYLHQHGHPVSVANPATVKAFATALLRRHKTDKSDAYVLALYQARMQPTAWHPPQRVHAYLQDLQRLRDDLHTDRTRVKNRLEGLRLGSPARRYLEQQVEQLDQQLTQVEQEIDTLREQDDTLSAQCQLLTSIVGIGPTSAIQLLAELPDLTQFAAPDQLVAYAGLCPHQHQSGSQPAKTWLSKQGNPRLRKILYFPALSAKQHNPHLRCFAQRLTAAGKAKMVVVAAVMRKLLVLVYAILKSGRPYDPTFGRAA